MSVKYTLKKETRHSSKYCGWYYGRAVAAGTVGVKELSRKINDMCTVTEPDIRAVISALVILLRQNLQDGKKIVLDDFGSFRVGLRSLPAPTPKDFTKRNIRELHIVFQPKAHLVNHHWQKDFLEGCDVEKMK